MPQCLKTRFAPQAAPSRERSGDERFDRRHQADVVAPSGPWAPLLESVAVKFAMLVRPSNASTGSVSSLDSFGSAVVHLLASAMCRWVDEQAAVYLREMLDQKSV